MKQQPGFVGLRYANPTYGRPYNYEHGVDLLHDLGRQIGGCSRRCRGAERFVSTDSSLFQQLPCHFDRREKSFCFGEVPNTKDLSLRSR
uniref:Uncharacterized protein n=1 Tax=Candidatus Kentrum sp. SD TaxID=2126332 RepID=A0A451BHF4_9GAMM|nr:MAG: hypothetical protein BECKSD772D_GA0070982_100153 [Candidatus Kentron sp. SD]